MIDGTVRKQHFPGKLTLHMTAVATLATAGLQGGVLAG
jgi:hypothetical protein